MNDFYHLLKEYWGFDAFRHKQLAVIEAIHNGKDTLALMPTGGGKSLCYQLPVLATPGIGLVISPLIALIKDQVDGLAKKNIKAINLSGYQSEEDLIRIFDNLKYGDYKFLFIAPERLQNAWFLEKLSHIKINYLVVDEAHCVSQWGHDFRPSYMLIKQLKTLFNLPLLALTATANQVVQTDIILSLGMQSPEIIASDFVRDNLQINIQKTNQKLPTLLKLVSEEPRSVIVYVSTRKQTKIIADYLSGNGISATSFHGGMLLDDKKNNMNAWLHNYKKIIVATNAFGMGIDKADVGLVVHYELPENIENYYQEIGRAGRDGQLAQGVLMYNDHDFEQQKNYLINQLVDVADLKKFYRTLTSYFQIAYGEGLGNAFEFSFKDLSKKHQFAVAKSTAYLKILEQYGVCEIDWQVKKHQKIQVIISQAQVMEYFHQSKSDNQVLMFLMRHYSGIFEYDCLVDLALLQKNIKMSAEDIHKHLNTLAELNIINYQHIESDICITFLEIREDDITIARFSKFLTKMNELKVDRWLKFQALITNEDRCLNRLILKYFDQNLSSDCGKCSNCVKTKQHAINKKLVAEQILDIVSATPVTFSALLLSTKLDEKVLYEIVEQLLENKILAYSNTNQLYKVK